MDWIQLIFLLVEKDVSFDYKKDMLEIMEQAQVMQKWGLYY